MSDFDKTNWTLGVTYLVGTGDEATLAINLSNTKERADKWLSNIVGRDADGGSFQGQMRELHWDNIPHTAATVFSRAICDSFDLPCVIKMTTVSGTGEVSEAEMRLVSKAIRVSDLNVDVPVAETAAYVDSANYTPGTDTPPSDQFPAS